MEYWEKILEESLKETQDLCRKELEDESWQESQEKSMQKYLSKGFTMNVMGKSLKETLYVNQNIRDII